MRVYRTPNNDGKENRKGEREREKNYCDKIQSVFHFLFAQASELKQKKNTEMKWMN